MSYIDEYMLWDEEKDSSLTRDGQHALHTSSSVNTIDGVPAGFSLDAGLWRDTDPEEGVTSRAFDGSANVGAFQTRNGKDAFGVNFEAYLAQIGLSTPGGGTTGGHSMDTPSADLSAYVYEDGLHLGCGYNILAGDVSFGDQDADSDHDRNLGLGLGAGGGFGFDAMWGDSDEDGEREVGFKAGLGPVSLQYTSEDFVGDAAMLALGGPQAVMVNAMMDGVGLGDYSPSGLIDDAFDAGTDAVGDAWDYMWSEDEDEDEDEDEEWYDIF